MLRLWAPWRLAYVESAADAGGKSSCFLCDFPAAERDAEYGIVWRGQRWYAILNAYPYTNGHLMLVLNRHHEGFIGLEADEAAEMAAALGRCEAAVREAYAPHGLNLGVNVGRVAGAGAVGHLHIHLVPRWNGDTNFMATTADTRVLPESLASSYTRLAAAFAKCAT
jgi:ATP adenylyltransferase